MKKRLISVLLIIVSIFCFSGCAPQEQPKQETKPDFFAPFLDGDILMGEGISDYYIRTETGQDENNKPIYDYIKNTDKLLLFPINTNKKMITLELNISSSYNTITGYLLDYTDTYIKLAFVNTITWAPYYIKKSNGEYELLDYRVQSNNIETANQLINNTAQIYIVNNILVIR